MHSKLKTDAMRTLKSALLAAALLAPALAIAAHVESEVQAVAKDRPLASAP